ncbi:MAG: ECF transporter S component [Lachnospiraceae bacterium]|jgi:uncharacterized membrane protein|nr:ECF transporter S component [Lachnospiraceae bacterium]
MKSKANFGTERLVQMALLVAIILLMAFTPIGYIKTLGLEITLIVVPVTIGAIALGAAGGALLGGVFGITSFIQCFGMSPFGTVLLGINPWATFIVCVVSRILMGWLTGLLFEGFKKAKVNKNLALAVTNLAGPLLNTFFFMSGLILFFYNTNYIQEIASTLGTKNVFTFVIAFVGVNGLVEAAACFVLGTAISKALDVYKVKAGKTW